jgi:hypothetical protein
MPRPYKVISCSTCGPEPVNSSENRFWSIKYFKHHNFWPGYRDPEAEKRVRQAKLPDETSGGGPLSDVQFNDNPGLW